MIDRFYYTMADIVGVSEAVNPNYAAENSLTFESVFAPLLTGFNANKAEINTLFQKHIWPTYGNMSIGFIDVPTIWCEDAEEPTLDDIKNSYNYKAVVGNIAAWLESTAPKYETLIKLYASQNANLMKALTSTSESEDSSNSMVNSTGKVNDTPQISGPIYADEYASQTTASDSNSENSGYSKTTTSVETDTVIARLDEIQKKLIDVYKKWSDEFRQFIIY